MKCLLIFLLFIGPLLLVGQQSSIRGVVSIHNSETETGKRQYVANAGVTDDFGKAQPVITDANGQFILIYVGVEEKSGVSFQVKKEGLEVVNTSALEAVTGQQNLVKISMASREKLDEYRRLIYKIGKTEAEKKLEKLVAQKSRELLALRQNAALNEIKIKRLEQDLIELEEQSRKIDDQAQELARKYAPINLDDQSAVFRNAFVLFQKGQLDSSLLILAKVNLANMVSQILTEREKLGELQLGLVVRDSVQKQRTKEVSEALHFKADLHLTNFEFDSVSTCYKLLLQLDSTDINTLYSYATFLQSLNRLNAATEYFTKAINAIKNGGPVIYYVYEPTLGRILNDLGSTYTLSNNYTNAEMAYSESLAIKKKLSLEEPGKYDEGMATVLNNLGVLYSKLHKYDKTEEMYKEVVRIRKQLATNNGKADELGVVMSLTNLGVLYCEKYDFLKAKAIFYEAIEMERKAIKSDPKTYEPELASTLMNMGLTYKSLNEFDSSAISFNESVEICKRLIKVNPEAYEPDMVYALHNLGELYSDTKDFHRSKAAYLEALEIEERLSKENHDMYDPEIAQTLNDLGILYTRHGDIDSAEKIHLQSLTIRTSLYKANPKTYGEELAQTHNNLANVYLDKKDYSRSEVEFNNALTLYKGLASQYPEVYMPNVASVLSNLGLLYSDMKEFQRAEEAMLQALDIRKGLAKALPQVHSLDLAKIELSLGTLYIDLKKYDDAEKLLLQSYTICSQGLQVYPEVFTPGWEFCTNQLTRLLATRIENTANKLDKVKWQQEIVTYTARVYNNNKPRIRARYANANGELCRLQLFARQFSEAVKSAKLALTIDNTLIWIKCELAHALLFDGKYEEAIKIYQEIKPLKTKEGKSYADICSYSLNELEKEGITNKDVGKVHSILRQ